MATNTNSTFRDTFVRIIAVLGLVAILLLGAWGIIQIAFWLPGFLSDIPGSISRMFRSEPPAETLVLSLPTTVKSGEEMNLTWNHNNEDGKYAYTLSYACSEGLSLKAPLPSGEYQSVLCNTPFNFTNAENTMKVIPVLAGNRTASTSVTVSAAKLESGVITATATGGTNITASIATSTAKPVTQKPVAASKPSAQYVASGRTQNLYGSPDVAVYITTNPGTVRAGSRISLQFVVENIGTNVTPSNWSFTASLPYNPVYTYASGGQQALYPGDKIIYTLGYDAVSNYNQQPGQPCILIYPPAPGCNNSQYPTYGGYGNQVSASLSIDPYNYVWESNENNNYASVHYTVY
jgi:hypothetical protein